MADSTGAISPIRSRMGGTCGQAVQMLISTDPARREDVHRIHRALFGDCLPNYDSSFFAGSNNAADVPDEQV
ncbi:MAG: hypothetical protein H0U76_29740 [Ktedonobacteraceae bacterium]|nr:hypothetical protein [Ktedonobacteraceae bacterium]